MPEGDVGNESMEVAVRILVENSRIPLQEVDVKSDASARRAAASVRHHDFHGARDIIAVESNPVHSRRKVR